MKLIHKSGEVSCNSDYDTSYWGCKYPAYGNNGLLTIITNANKESVFPPVDELKNVITDCAYKKHFYSLDRITHTSPELVFRDLSNPLSVSRNQELQIWYAQDWIDCLEDDNTGATCVDVYAWYA